MGVQSFMAKDQTRYCGLVRGPQMEKKAVTGIPNRLNGRVIFIVHA